MNAFRSKGISEYLTPLIFLIIMMGLLLLAGLYMVNLLGGIISNREGYNDPALVQVIGQDTRPLSLAEATPQLGAKLIFPEGWHMVGYSAANGYAHFVCQRGDELRECLPSWSK